MQNSPDSRLGRRVAIVFLSAGLLLGLVGLFIREANLFYVERSVDSLHTIYGAQLAYASAHPDRGFAHSLSELGPESGAIIDGVLASGRKSGYILTLIAASPDAQGRVTRYTVVARPVQYSKGMRSFFIDESGVEHFTREDRAPSVGDPVGGPWSK